MALGYGVGWWMLPGESWMVYAFLGAMLAATSVGITARVLQEAKATKTPSARIILGAAVIDDVLGLVLLAIVAGVIRSAAEGTTVAAPGILAIVLKASGFLAGAILVGSYLSPRLFRQALALRSKGVVLALALGFCFGLAWLAMQAGLAAIVGAFAAGLVMEDVHFADHLKRGETPLHESLHALTGLLVPVFFVRMGILVHIETFLRPGVIGFAVLITVAAMIGKWACGLVTPRGVSRTTVGLGMMPRGEVGLIFAGIGAALVLHGRPVVSPRNLRGSLVHGRGDNNGDTSAPPLVAEAARDRGEGLSPEDSTPQVAHPWSEADAGSLSRPGRGRIPSCSPS